MGIREKAKNHVIILVFPDEAKPSSDNNLHGCAELTGDSYDATQSCVT